MFFTKTPDVSERDGAGSEFARTDVDGLRFTDYFCEYCYGLQQFVGDSPWNPHTRPRGACQPPISERH